MEIGKTLHVVSRNAWRSWLAKHHATEHEIWLVYYRKDTGRPRISYDDAVLEALAYGWIDSIEKRLDDERLVQRFSPRKPTSKLSEMNRIRVRELIREGKMTQAGLSAIAHVYTPETDREQPFTVPRTILAAIRKNKRAWAEFQRLPEDYKRIRIAYIESRKRHGIGMYTKALSHFIRKTAAGKRIGFVKERTHA